MFLVAKHNNLKVHSNLLRGRELYTQIVPFFPLIIWKVILNVTSLVKCDLGGHAL